MSQPRLFRIIDRAVYEYKLIEPGDNILVGASGGKDSTALLEYFAYRKKQGRENFNFTALHVQSDISGALDQDLIHLFKTWGVDLRVVQISVLERLKPDKKMNCWWCSTQRRTELNNYALANGFNKIALGHHMDDILETLLMNALTKAELSTMPVSLKYNKYPITIIRPLCFATVDNIISHAKEAGYISSTCTCNYQDNSTRKEARKRLALLTNNNAKEKQHLFMALRNVKLDYLTYPQHKGDFNDNNTSSL